MPTTMLPLQGALQTLVLTAGAEPETQRSPQTTPPRELLTPGRRWRGGEGEPASDTATAWQLRGRREAVPSPEAVGPPSWRRGESYLQTFTEPTPSHNLLGEEIGRKRSAGQCGETWPAAPARWEVTSRALAKAGGKRALSRIRIPKKNWGQLGFLGQNS